MCQPAYIRRYYYYAVSRIINTNDAQFHPLIFLALYWLARLRREDVEMCDAEARESCRGIAKESFGDGIEDGQLEMFDVGMNVNVG